MAAAVALATAAAATDDVGPAYLDSDKINVALCELYIQHQDFLFYSEILKSKSLSITVTVVYFHGNKYISF